MPHSPARRPLAAAFVLLAALAVPRGGASGDEPTLDAHLQSKSPAIVTVKYVWKGDNWEANQEVRGVMVEGTGLVMLSGLAMAGDGAPTDLKILFGSDAKEWSAVLVAKDTLLNLAYVQILDPEGKTFDAVDLAQGVEPKVGQSLFGVSRGGRGFDFAPAVRRLYVAGKIEKPRSMWDIGGDFTENGLPVFDLSGKPVGVLVTQEGSEGADEGRTSETFLLGLDAVRKSLAQAKKRVPDAVAKAKEKAAAPKEEPAMDAEKPPEPEKPR
jgi:hypothetical protein